MVLIEIGKMRTKKNEEEEYHAFRKYRTISLGFISENI